MQAKFYRYIEITKSGTIVGYKIDHCLQINEKANRILNLTPENSKIDFLM